MRLVNDSDTRTFTDPSGDSLTTLAYVRQRDLERSNELQQEAAFDSLKKLGMTVPEAMEHAKNASAEDQAAARADTDPTPPAKVRRFRLEAIARELVIGGQKYGGNAILEAYDKMDVESAKWVDDQVARIWEPATPDDAQRES